MDGLEDNTLVSVIMSVYDGDSAVYLRESIHSVVNQSYKNIEIILIGDGVTELNLLNEIRGMELQYSDVLSYLPQDKNKGLASCMNLAISKAIGCFIARMDADDIMDLKRLEEQVIFLKENSQVDIVGSFIKEFNIDSGSEKLVVYPVDHESMKSSFGKRNPLAHPSVMMKRSFFDKAGYYPLHTDKDEDTILWLNGFLNNCRFANIPQPLTNMRVSNGFFERRSGIFKAWQDFRNRSRVIMSLDLSKKNFIYSIGRFIIQIIPSPFIKRYIYMNYR